jgi:hypothetical protein
VLGPQGTDQLFRITIKSPQAPLTRALPTNTRKLPQRRRVYRLAIAQTMWRQGRGSSINSFNASDGAGSCIVNASEFSPARAGHARRDAPPHIRGRIASANRIALLRGAKTVVSGHTKSRPYQVAPTVVGARSLQSRINELSPPSDQCVPSCQPMKHNDAAQNAKRTAAWSSKMLNDPTTTKTDGPVMAF